MWTSIVMALGLSMVATSPAEGYVQRLEKAIGQAREDISSVTASAETGAEAYLGGGRIWAAGRQEDFVSEAVGRAGGLMSIAALGTHVPSEGDIVLYAVQGGLNDTDRERIRLWRGSEAVVVTFASSAGLYAKRVPVDTVANVIDLWTWTGEFVAACTRKGKMPVLYESYGLPGGRDRGKRYRGQRYHDDMTTKPIEAGVLGKAYLDAIAGMLKRIVEKQMPDIVRAGRWWRAVGKADAVTLTIGHMFPRHFQDSRAGTYSDYKRAPAFEDRELLDANDPKRFVLYVGYQMAPQALVDQAAVLPTKLVYFSARQARGPEGVDNVVYIDPQWPVGDACVTVPGYDIPILPASGVIDAAIYWSIVSQLPATASRPGDF